MASARSASACGNCPPSRPSERRRPERHRRPARHAPGRRRQWPRRDPGAAKPGGTPPRRRAPYPGARRVSVLAACAGLFLAAFLAATLLPAQSEAVLAGLLLSTDTSPVLLVAVATAGNVTGSLVNYALGRGIERFRDRSWFPVPNRALARAQGWYARGGRWVLLLSWLPVVGDPLTFVAGVMKEKWWVFLLLVSLGKASRYVVLAWVVAG